MYVGHAALALIAKTKRPKVPIALLVPIAFAPDWIESAADVLHLPHAKFLSHGLLSVVICSIMCGVLYATWRHDAAGGAVVCAAYASHWPADFITGIKPTWPGGPYVGLMLYNHLGYDFLVESIIVVAAWLYYRRTLPAPERGSGLAWLLPVGLILMQALFAVIQDPGFLGAG